MVITAKEMKKPQIGNHVGMRKWSWSTGVAAQEEHGGVHHREHEQQEQHGHVGERRQVAGAR